VTLGLNELRTGIICLGNFDTPRGTPPVDLPGLSRFALES
jgi:hypothetical protein